MGERLNGCAVNVYRQRVDGFYRLAGAWEGWKISGDKLHGPGGMRFTAGSLKLAWMRLQRIDYDNAPSAPTENAGIVVIQAARTVRG